MIAMLVFAAPVDGGDSAVAKLKEHLSGITSVRVKYTTRVLTTGGVRAADPASAQRSYDPRTPTIVRDLWLDPPRQRQLVSRQQPGNDDQIGEYFDGTTYTRLDFINKSGQRIPDGASRVPRLDLTPLMALGYAYAETTNTRLGAAFAGETGVTVVKVSADEWMVEAKSLPDAVRPGEWNEKGRRGAVTRAWVALTPEFELRRWAYYRPPSAKVKGLRSDPVPTFDAPGLELMYGYVNCGSQAAVDQRRGRVVRVPTVILHGNEHVNMETTVQEVIYDPRVASDTFLPGTPAGWAISEVGKTGTATHVAGGAQGEAMRVGEITERAKAMLADGDTIRAKEGWPWWAYPLLGSLMAVVCGVVILRVRRVSQ